MRYLSLLAFVCLVSAGCATGYAPSGLSGGYNETQLGPDVYQVSFKGNSYTDMDRAVDFTLLRCAELSLENGYPYFVIVDASQWTKNESYTSPTHTTTTANAYGTGNYAYGTAQSTTTGGQTYHSAKPRTTNTMLMLHDKQGVNGLVYDAQFVANSLREKYGIEPEAVGSD